MISLIDRNLPNGIIGDEPTSGRLLSWWEAYRDTPIARFYQTEHGGAIAVMDTQAVVCVPAEDTEEVSAFLSLQPEICSIYTSDPTCCIGKVKHFTAMMAPNITDAEKLETVSLRDLHPFLQPFFDDLPPFEAWYLDVSYRTRHDLCRHAAITDNGVIASSAMTVAEWQNGALLGGVATAPAYRRRGYAGRCVLSLTAALQQRGKTVWICPYNLPAQRLYESLGFRERATVTVIERK
jgi:ribosomal protein S18 acetylase RimI-like enzyme